MSACRCPERLRPFAIDLPDGSNDRPRQWFVTRRNESRSAFNGYRSEWSDKSSVECRVCSAYWSTKAQWVSKLRDCEFFPHHSAPRAEAFPESPTPEILAEIERIEG